jgi:hypothetical protein
MKLHGIFYNVVDQMKIQLIFQGNDFLDYKHYYLP